jgi:hypothetical protein
MISIEFARPGCVVLCCISYLLGCRRSARPDRALGTVIAHPHAPNGEKTLFLSLSLRLFFSDAVGQSVRRDLPAEFST